MQASGPELPRSLTDVDQQLLQSERKTGTKWWMATVPLVLAAVVTVVSVPLIWFNSQSVDGPAFSRSEEQISQYVPPLESAGQSSSADPFQLISTLDGVGYPALPSLESALSEQEHRELVAHFAQSRAATSLRGAAGTESSSSSASSVQNRMRVRIEDLKFPEPPTPPEDPRRAVKQYGVYLTAGSMSKDAFVEETMQDLIQRGANAFVFDIKGSFVYFPSQSPLANEWDMVRPLVDLPAVIQRAHELGLYTIGRYIAVKDPVLAEIKPELSLRHPKTNADLQTQWVEPSNPTVHQYNREVIKEIALSGIDEINLDYIRYPTSLPQTFSLLSTEEKSARIGSFIKVAREAIDEAGSDTKLGISSYAILGWNYQANLPNLGQDVVQFAPLLDVISPMAYPSTFSETGYGSDPNGRSRDYWLVYRTLTGYKKLLGPDHDWKLRPWIQAYYKNSKNIRDQIDAVIDSGGCGFTMWSAANDYTQAYLAFNNWKQPEHCQVHPVVAEQ